MKCIESLCQNLVKGKESRRIISLEESIHKREAIFIIKDIEIPQYILIFYICSTKGHSLVEDSQRVAHRSVCLVSNHMKRLVVNCHIFT